jgi:hypothetical protein
LADSSIRITFDPMVDPQHALPQPPEHPGQRMQRLRVGITGLAAILIVVLLATAIATGLRRNVASEAPVVAPPPVVATVTPGNGAAVADPNAEPLAQLGAAPGGGPVEKTQPKGPAR